MTLRKGEDIENRKKDKITLCGELALEEAMTPLRDGDGDDDECCFVNSIHCG
jgi:hypothetical protein